MTCADAVFMSAAMLCCAMISNIVGRSCAAASLRTADSMRRLEDLCAPLLSSLLVL